MFADQKYCAKILLFGEYTVIFGGGALAIPYPKYSGTWVKNPKPDKRLLAYLPYLKEINNDLHYRLDPDKLSRFWHQGWTFDSTIPPGYGLGSSAALCASIYHASWHTTNVHPTSQQAKEDIARLESYYHGKSSGFDALVSLYLAPVLFQEGKTILCHLPERFPYHWSLWNTGIKRSTEPLVNQFRKQLIDPGFNQKMEVLTELSNSVLSAFLSGKKDFSTLKKISSLQYDHLRFLIPQHCRTLWKKTLDNPDIAIKLCGAGGGGYLLVAFQNATISQQFFGPGELEPVRWDVESR